MLGRIFSRRKNKYKTKNTTTKLQIRKNDSRSNMCCRGTIVFLLQHWSIESNCKKQTGTLNILRYNQINANWSANTFNGKKFCFTGKTKTRELYSIISRNLKPSTRFVPSFRTRKSFDFPTPSYPKLHKGFNCWFSSFLKSTIDVRGNHLVNRRTLLNKLFQFSYYHQMTLD